MNSSKYILFLFTSIVGILLIVETLSLLYLKKNSFKTESFFIHLNPYKNDGFKRLTNFEFDIIDPLVGWKMSNESLNKKGFEVKNDLIILKTNNNSCESKQSILITGGSTSDIGLHKHNWPIFLSEIFKEKNHCVDIYIGAVGGYNSGQELLLLISKLKDIKPNVIISYSGANEGLFPSYVSEYEYGFFKNFTTEKLKLLPNFKKLWKMKTNENESLNLKLATAEKRLPHKFWLENMKYMNSLALGANSKFIGILQPVYNYSGRDIQESDIENHAYNEYLYSYSKFYPYCKEETFNYSFTYDFTNVFTGIAEDPFEDDCHLKEDYQHIIADTIYQLLLDSNYLHL